MFVLSYGEYGSSNIDCYSIFRAVSRTTKSVSVWEDKVHHTLCQWLQVLFQAR